MAHLPLSVGVDGSLGSAVEDVRGTDVTTLLVVLGGVAVAGVVLAVVLVLEFTVVSLVVVALLLGLGEAVHEVVGRLVSNVGQQTVDEGTVSVQLVLDGLYGVVVVLKAEGQVVQVLVLVGALRHFGDVVMVRGVAVSGGLGVRGVGVVVGVVGGQVLVLSTEGVVLVVGLVRVAVNCGVAVRDRSVGIGMVDRGVGSGGIRSRSVRPGGVGSRSVGSGGVGRVGSGGWNNSIFSMSFSYCFIFLSLAFGSLLKFFIVVISYHKERHGGGREQPGRDGEPERGGRPRAWGRGRPRQRRRRGERR